jgi:hypothetical protein
MPHVDRSDSRWLRPVPPPSELRPVDHRRPAPTDSADRPSAPRPRAEAAEPALRETRGRAPADRQQPERVSDALARFEPTRAGLPEVSKQDAARYIETRRSDHPWLNAARHSPSEVQQVFAALDQGSGHAHIRHEGWLSPEKSQLRVQYLQDPAQLDPAKKTNGEDGLLPGSKKHYCAAMSTAIRHPTTFAEAFARGTEHPAVRKVLDAPVKKDHKPPEAVGVPIADLLGHDGHQRCEGYQLAGNDDYVARHDRRTWLRETQAGESPSVPPPLVVPVDFRDGTIQFRFRVNAAKTCYEVLTMFPDPPRRQPEHP